MRSTVPEHYWSEPTGSRALPMLQVPPLVRSARKAVAWTFGLKEEEYKPVMET